MISKKINIVCFPDGASKVWQFKLRKCFLFLLSLLFLSVTALLIYGVRDYRAIKRQIPKLAQFEKENKEQRVQIAAFSKKIEEVSAKLVGLKKFDRQLKLMVNLEPSEDDSQFVGVGGYDPELVNQSYSIEKAHRNLVRSMHQSLNNLGEEICMQTNEKAELLEFLRDQKSMLACTPSVWPTRGWISSGFGYRISPFTNEREFHRGLDIATRMNSEIVAPADGVVSSIAWEYGFGRVVTVNHDYGLKTKYGHLAKALVKKGQYIKRGQKIALVGNTGRSTGPHLHYEVHLKGVPVNPLRYILN